MSCRRVVYWRLRFATPAEVHLAPAWLAGVRIHAAPPARSLSQAKSSRWRDGAGRGTRTLTAVAGLRLLRPLRLPFRHPRGGRASSPCAAPATTVTSRNHRQAACDRADIAAPRMASSPTNWFHQPHRPHDGQRSAAHPGVRAPGGLLCRDVRRARRLHAVLPAVAARRRRPHAPRSDPGAVGPDPGAHDRRAAVGAARRSQRATGAHRHPADRPEHRRVRAVRGRARPVAVVRLLLRLRLRLPAAASDPRQPRDRERGAPWLPLSARAPVGVAGVPAGDRRGRRVPRARRVALRVLVDARAAAAVAARRALAADDRTARQRRPEGAGAPTVAGAPVRVVPAGVGAAAGQSWRLLLAVDAALARARHR